MKKEGKRGQRTVHALEDAVDGAGAAAAGHFDVEVVVVRCCCCCCGGGGGHFFCEWWVFGFGFGFGLYRIGIVGKIDGWIDRWIDGSVLSSPAKDAFAFAIACCRIRRVIVLVLVVLYWEAQIDRPTDRTRCRG